MHSLYVFLNFFFIFIFIMLSFNLGFEITFSEKTTLTGYPQRDNFMYFLSLQPELRIDFENAVSGLKISNTNVIAVKKLSTMTPLQILCSFQTWNAKNVSDSVHKCLEKLVSTLLDKGQCVNFTFKDGGTIQGKKVQILKPKKYKNCIGDNFFHKIN